MIEITEQIAILKPIQSTKKGREEDSPLIATFKLEFKDLAATAILPYFHPCLRDYLFCENGLRFSHALGAIKWNETHRNAEIETMGHVLQASRLSGYVIAPWVDSAQEGEEMQKVRLSFGCVVDIAKHMMPAFALLCEAINSEIPVSIRASQLVLEELRPEEVPAIEPINIKMVGKDENGVMQLKA